MKTPTLTVQVRVLIVMWACGGRVRGDTGCGEPAAADRHGGAGAGPSGGQSAGAGALRATGELIASLDLARSRLTSSDLF